MVSALSSGDSTDADDAELSELKNRIKSSELDFERRITLIENATKEMQKAVGSIEQFESSESAVIEIQEIKKTLREIEDTGLIAKLETISNGDKIAEITELLETVDEKIKLLVDAVEILSESRPQGGADNPAALNEISSMKSEIDTLKNALSKMVSVAEPERISALAGRVASLENANSASGADLKEAYESYRKKIDVLEQRISSVPAPSEIPKGNISDMIKLKEDVEKLKDLIKNVVDTLETHSSEHDSGSKSGPGMDAAAYKNIYSTITGLSQKVAEINREMSLERAMYPQDITGIKKDMANLRIVQKSLADTLESIAKVKSENTKANYSEDRMKSVNAALSEISFKVSEISALKGKLNSLDEEIKSIKNAAAKNTAIPAGVKDANRQTAAYAENKKIETLEKNVSGLSEKLGIMQDLKEEIAAISAKIGSQDREFTAQKNNYKDAKENDALFKMIKTIAEENRNLRQEIEQLKQVCTEIMRENREQPIIID